MTLSTVCKVALFSSCCVTMTIACIFIEVYSSNCNSENLDDCKVLVFSCNVIFGCSGFIRCIQRRTYGLKDGEGFFGVVVLGNKQVVMWSVANKGKVKHLGFVSFFNKKGMEFLSVKLNVLLPCVYLFLYFRNLRPFKHLWKIDFRLILLSMDSMFPT